MHQVGRTHQSHAMEAQALRIPRRHRASRLEGILIHALFSFLISIQEASATIFLTRGGWEMIPFGIFTFYIAGSQS